MTTPQPPVHRNDLCPCGSGKKYKKCCYEKAAHGPAPAGSTRIVGIVLATAALGGVVYSMWPKSQSQPAASAAAPATNSVARLPAAPGLTPPAWYYDTAANRHWHPEHAHWHDGPPPTQPGAGTTVTTTTASSDPSVPNPAPWHYDAPSNKHWHPGHGHWHDGPPPPESERNSQTSPAAQPQILEVVPVPTAEGTPATPATPTTPTPTPPATPSAPEGTPK